MTWSRGTSGSASAVAAQMQDWPETVEAESTPGAVAGLTKEQATRACAVASTFLEKVKDGHNVGISTHGHAAVAEDGTVTADQWGISISSYLPVPVAAATPVDEPVAG